MFFRSARADTSDRSVFGDFWFSPLTFSRGGQLLSADGALALTAVWACVRNISEDIAKLPFKLYRPRAGGGKDQVVDHWLYRLFAKAPNFWQTPFEWREMLQGHLELRGNAFNRIIDDGRGGIAQLIPLHPDRMRMELLDNGSFRYRFTALNGQQEILRRDQVWHLRGFGSDGYMGYSTVQVQRQALGVGLSRQEYAARFFDNDAKPTSGWIEMPGAFGDKAARDTFKESWKESQSRKNRGKVPVLERGMKYHEVGFNNKDSQFVEASQMSVVEAARMFRMPPHKIQELSRATFANIEQQNIEYATDCIQSRCERWESSIQSALLGEDDDLECEFDISSLMRGDMAARSAYINTGVMNGTLTRNEGREMEGRNPIDGLDEPLQPLNMIEAGEEPPPASTPPAGPPAPAEDDKPSDGDDDASARFAAVLASNSQRLARRFASAKVLSAESLAEALAIDLARAAAWLAANTDSGLTVEQAAESLVALATAKETT